MEHFNPRSPQGERLAIGRITWRRTHFNPRSPQGERLIPYLAVTQVGNISIHAPRRGSDLRQTTRSLAIKISIHAPRRGSDQYTFTVAFLLSDFNPRSPQGERLYPDSWDDNRWNISIHAPRRGSDRNNVAMQRAVDISIHAPRRGSDIGPFVPSCTGRNFNPRSPQGERHYYALKLHRNHNFNPRSPQGERHASHPGAASLAKFQSTLPAGGATANMHKFRGIFTEYSNKLPRN